MRAPTLLTLLGFIVLAGSCATNERESALVGPQSAQSVRAAALSPSARTWHRQPLTPLVFVGTLAPSKDDLIERHAEELEEHLEGSHFAAPLRAHGPVMPLAAHVNFGGVETFVGKSRKLAKTSLVHATPEMPTLPQLVAQLKGKVPPELQGGPSPANRAKPRVPAEMRNVQVEAYLLFFTREKDNDFHLILGATPNINDHHRFTAEVSGRPSPANADSATLKAARESFIQAVSHSPTIPASSSYVQVQPIPVRVTGSLFFDIEHPDGVGPIGYEAATNWEIHPVSEIVFGSQ